MENTNPQKEASGQLEAPSHEGHDQWQGLRLLAGLGACVLFVIAAIVYERCG